MNVKTTFLNGALHEGVYKDQLEVFQRQWYLKFHKILITLGFKENPVDQCIYLKISGSKICIIFLYVDILFASNNMRMIHETKQFIYIYI